MQACCARSRTELVGSLADGNADEFSDIDLLWIVPDAEFAACLSGAVAALERVRSVTSVRSDPDFHRSLRRRLLFVRFARVPLFWRLDLDIRCASVAGDPDHDTGNPAARARAGEWSRPASALANAVGAVKAVARGRQEQARGLLDRGFARIGVPDRASGDWGADVARLAWAAVAQDPSLAEPAAEVGALARAYLGSG
ncbi:hypothetical protein ADK64_32310 [Streptomyces sp. MMG1121]|nr:hypothetical protein ADK64_32310 [Streptomyces sp. MMG1121]